ncbi:hypothetical protein GCM10009716_14610 [Streptomyces sodiiphilus]|uniref:Uncharacterized protein n=1 Tax=Streptomyces sodiiphilus TaxID=226217 RepID=A0ABP5AA36_9ACTN
MPEHRRATNRRPLLTGVAAGGVLCAVWLMPSAYADNERPAPSQGEQQPSSEDIRPAGAPAAD